MKFIERLRAMSDEQKKLFFYATIILAALAIGSFSIFSLKKNVADLSASISSVQLPAIQLPASQEQVASNPTNQTPASQQPQQAYVSQNQDFLIAYPDGWAMTRESTDGLQVDFEKKDSDTVADFTLEVVSKTQNITTAEQGIDKSIATMKDVVEQKQSMTVGQNYNGYEAVGTTCVALCTVPTKAVYAPFSVIYFEAGTMVFKIKYAEGMVGQGWETDWNNWQTYGEFKKMLSTFTMLK